MGTTNWAPSVECTVKNSSGDDGATANFFKGRGRFSDIMSTGLEFWARFSARCRLINSRRESDDLCIVHHFCLHTCMLFRNKPRLFPDSSPHLICKSRLETWRVQATCKQISSNFDSVDDASPPQLSINTFCLLNSFQPDGRNCIRARVEGAYCNTTLHLHPM